MANNIGLDFGTTYSVISRLKNVTRKADGSIESYELETCLPNEGALSPYIDSVVFRRKDGTLLCGHSTRNETVRKGITVYKGFKMMLTENNDTVLKERGYDKDYTPARIVKEYIDDVLQGYITTCRQETSIDKVVIGVPEIWFSDAYTIDCRTTLEDIVSSLEYVNEVELVSEPAAACAFFVEKYKQKKNEPFNGKILLVDYGGGTLDIALCDVKDTIQNSEISVIKRCGAGLNEEGFIGKAGFAFLEAVVKLALKPTGLSDEEIIGHRRFHSWVNSLESELMNGRQMKAIEETFSSVVCQEDREALLDPEYDAFCTIYFDEDDENGYCITYGMLAMAYNNIIYPVLNEKLDEVIEYMNDNNITVDKFVTVGGFCNFFLTHDQIKNKFFNGSDDPRFSDIIDDRRECEAAISYGAALIAEGVVSYKQLAPYHLGFGKGSKNELQEIYYVINKGDDIVYDEPVFMKNEDGTDMLFAAKKIPLLVFNLDDSCNEKNVLWGEPLEEYQKKLSLQPLQDKQRYKLGISLDRSMIITLHKQKVNHDNPSEVYESSRVRLNDIYAVLGDLIKARSN